MHVSRIFVRLIDEDEGWLWRKPIGRNDARSIFRQKNHQDRTELDDVAGHLRTPEEMAAYLEACMEEANGDAAFIAKALGDIVRANGITQVALDAGRHARACTKPCLATAARVSIRFSKWSTRWD